MEKHVISAKEKKSDQFSFLTVRETAELLRLCEKQVRRLIRRGELAAVLSENSIRPGFA